MSNRSKPSRPRAEPTLELSTFLPYRLSVLASVISEGLARAYAQFEISIPEWRVIATIGEFGSVTSKEIARHAHMNKVQVTRAAAFLEDRRLIRRVPNRSDLREQHLVFTPAGARMYRSIADLAKTYAARLTEDFTGDDMAALDRVILLLEAAAPQD